MHWVVWGMGVGLVVLGVLVVLFRHHFYFGPPLPEVDDLAEWRQLGAEAWGVEKPGSWEPVREVLRLMDEAEAAAVATAEASPRPEGVRPDTPAEADFAFDVDESKFVVGTEPDEMPEVEWRWYRSSAERALEDMERRGVFDQIRELPGQAPVLDGWLAQGVTPVDYLLHADLGRLRSASRVITMRLRLAFDRNDATGVEAAFGESLALARVVLAQPLGIQRLVGIAIERAALSVVRTKVTAGDLDELMLKAIDSVLERHSRPALSPVLRGEMVFMRAYTRDLFSRYDLSWWGPTSAAANFEPQAIVLEAAVRAVEMSPQEGLAEIVDAHHRATGPEFDHLVYARAGEFVQLEVPAESSALRADTIAELVGNGVRVAIRLELERQRTGRLPRELDGLGLSEDVLTDPYTGQRLIYNVGDDPSLPIDDGNSVLYSTGFDGADDDANAPTVTQRQQGIFADQPNGAGFDIDLLREAR